MSFSHAAKTIVLGAPTLLTGGVPGARAGNENLAINRPALFAPTSIQLNSTEFQKGQEIPARYSAGEQNISPPLSWSNVPAQAKSLVLLVEDPDAPLPEPFVHWLAYNISSNVASLPEGLSIEEKTLVHQGKNSTLKVGWTGMAPPKGDTRHHYHFQMFALDQMLPLEDACGRSALLKAMEGHILARGELIGTYRRE